MCWRKVLAIGLCLVCAAAIGARIWWVNETSFSVPQERYATGEWVSFDGSFLTTNDEKNDGYSMRVDGAEIMSEQEYIDRYDVNGIWKENELTSDPSDVDCLAVLTITVKNEGNDNSEGFAINLSATSLVASDNIDFLVPQLDFWGTSEPKITSADDIPLVFNIKPDTEYTIHMPFTLGRDIYMDKREVKEGSYYLYVTRGPVMKLVEVDVEHAA